MTEEPRPPSERIDAILAEIEDEQRAWVELVSRMTAEQIRHRQGEDMSALQSLIHVAAWQEHALQIARLQSAPGASDLPVDAGPSRVLQIDGERFNAELRSLYADWTLGRALEWSSQVNADLRAALSALPPERLLGGPGPHGARNWYGKPGLLHTRDHRRTIERQLSSSTR